MGFAEGNKSFSLEGDAENEDLASMRGSMRCGAGQKSWSGVCVYICFVALPFQIRRVMRSSDYCAGKPWLLGL